MILDTHEAVEKIVEAGASKKMAEAIVALHAKGNENLATKEDIKIVRSEISQVRIELKADLFQVKTELKGEIAQVKTELSWIKAMLFAVLGLLLAPMVAQFVALYFK